MTHGQVVTLSFLIGGPALCLLLLAGREAYTLTLPEAQDATITGTLAALYRLSPELLAGLLAIGGVAWSILLYHFGLAAGRREKR